MARHKFEYKLAPRKSREDPTGPRNYKPGETRPQVPMLDQKVKPNWQGKTKEQLLAEPDFLPACVRELPRAYLVPPATGEDRKRKFGQSKSTESSRSNLAQASTSTMAGLPPLPPSLPSLPPLPPPLPPPPTPSILAPPSSIAELGRYLGPVVDYIERTVTHRYEFAEVKMRLPSR